MKSREFLYEKIKKHDINFSIPKKYYFLRICDKIKSGVITTKHDFDITFNKNATGAELILDRKNLDKGYLLRKSEIKIYRDLLDYFLISQHIYSDEGLSEVDLSNYKQMHDKGVGIYVDGTLFSVGFDNDFIFVRPTFRDGRVLWYDLYIKVIDDKTIDVDIDYDCQAKSCEKYKNDDISCGVCNNCFAYGIPSIERVTEAVQLVLTALTKDSTLQEFEDVEFIENRFQGDVNNFFNTASDRKSDMSSNKGTASSTRDSILKLLNDINTVNKDYKYMRYY